MNNPRKTAIMISKEKVIIPLLMVIAPFLAFLYSVRKPLVRVCQYGIVFFFFILGYHRKLWYSGDANTWTEAIMDFNRYGLTSLEDRILSYQGFNIGYLSFLYLLSRIDYTAIIWAVVFSLTAIAFLFFYRMQIVNQRSIKLEIYDILLFFLFLEYIPFNSYGVKFWVALMVFVLGFCLSLSNARTLGGFLVLISASFHYAMAYLVFLYMISYFTYGKNLVRKILILAIVFILLVTLSRYLEIAFLEEKVNAYSGGSLVENKAMWIIVDRFLTTIISSLFVFYTCFISIKERETAFFRYFLFVFVLGLIPLVNTLDGLDRYSRAFSFMTLLFIIRVRFCKVFIPHYFRYGILAIFSWHLVVNYLLRKGELDFDVFYQNLFVFFSNGSMSQILY